MKLEMAVAGSRMGRGVLVLVQGCKVTRGRTGSGRGIYGDEFKGADSMGRRMLRFL